MGATNHTHSLSSMREIAIWNYKSVLFSLLPLVYICLWVFKVLQAFLMAWMVKNLPVLQENEVRSLGREDPLGKGMATHSSILAWRIPWPEKPGGLQSIGLQRVRHDQVPFTFI